MLDKIKKAFNWLTNIKLPISKTGANLWIVGIYGVICIAILITFMVAWLYNYANGNVDLVILKELFDSLTDPQCVAAVTFIAMFTVDRDNDGVSDAIENELEELKDNERG